MKLRILGCAGGIGGRQRLTTCLRVDHDILLDAGTGLSSLGLDELVRIDHVFLSHSHLDHVAGLALLVDAVFGKRTGPVTVHASEAVIASLKQHLFNWVMWPNFAELPHANDSILRWSPFRPGEAVTIGRRVLTSHPVNHTAGSVAYHVRQGDASFLFSGDMRSTPELWDTLKADPTLQKVIVDCSFPNAEATLAEKSGHFCPQSLVTDIAAMPAGVEFLIYHLKPGQEELIMRQLADCGAGRSFRALQCGDQFEFDDAGNIQRPQRHETRI